jgi:LPS-assembly lipoprotein
MRLTYLPASLVLCILLSGCGFTPLYGTHSAAHETGVSGQMNTIEISNIRDRTGQDLRNRLIDRFYAKGRPVEALYRLEISEIREDRTELDITKTADTTRTQLKLTTHMRVVDLKTRSHLLDRDLTAITSYNILRSQFTTRITEQNARDNALEDLARQTELQTALYLKRQEQK